ncbi:MAG: alpha/beta hydrolase [Allorhizobium sp.]
MARQKNEFEPVLRHMSTIHLRISTVLLALVAFAHAAIAADGLLKPYKNALFSEQAVLESRDGGAFEVIDYQEMRDINGRDQIPERRVKSRYVELGVRRQQVDETLELGDRTLDVTRVGSADSSRFSVIFIHGRGGDRRLGANDFSFGGNFNRLKNLSVDNGGTYYAPSVKSFDSDGVTDIAALIAEIARRSPGRPIVLSCASMGSFICWGISRDAQTVERLAGMAVLGGAADPDYAKSAAFKAGLPLYFTHGGNDPVYAAADQIEQFERLRKSGYPTRFRLYQGGSHGTPVRMTDWWQVLNWIMEKR